MASLRDEVTRFCARHHLRLNTDLGQHYLVDEDVLAAIIESAKIEQDDAIVEIGAGIGVLTRELVKTGASVEAIELDTRVLPLLREFTSVQSHADRLHLIEGNALEIPFPKTPYKIVANIPYHITSPLLRHAFLESARPPTSLTLLIQREVAEKICDDHDRGILTIVVSLFGTPRIVRHVPPSSFLPPPKVDSSVLHIDCFEKPLADAATIDQLLSLVKLGFGQKRKMLRNTLGSLPDGMKLLETVGIEPTRRPQTLTTDEWIALAKARSAKAEN